MKAPLSQNFKLPHHQQTKKRSLIEENTNPVGREVKHRIPLSASSRTEQDFYHRRLTPDGSQLLGSSSLYPSGADIQKRGQQSQKPSFGYNSIQQIPGSGTFRSPSQNQSNVQTIPQLHTRNDSLSYQQTYQSKDEEPLILMSGGGFYPRNQYQQYTADKQRKNYEERFSTEQLQNRKRDYMLSNSLDDQVQSDQSPQIYRGFGDQQQSKETNKNNAGGELNPNQNISRFNYNSKNQMDAKFQKQQSQHQPLPRKQNYQQFNDEIGSPNRNQDMEQIIMNLHSKMKNLESKYIDLANFYKKELVTQKQGNSINAERSPFRQGLFGNDTSQSRFYNTSIDRDSRSRSPMRSNTEPLDQTQEKALINELLQEKNDLEQELQNIVFIQNKLQEEDLRMNERLTKLDMENQQLRQKNPTGSAIQLRQESIERLKQQVQGVLDSFENDFLDFINQNYQSFTENDVLGLFGNLRIQVNQIIESISMNRGDSARQPFTQIQSNEQIQILEQQRSQILDNFKKDMNEYEINNEYTFQKIKKSAFELQNKQDMTKLDLKKVSLTLSQLTKNASELSQNQGNTSSHSSYGSNNFKQKSNIFDLRNPLSPTNANSQQNNLASEIQNQVQVLTQTFNSINKKISGNDKDLKYLSEIENENLQNIQFFKDSLENMMEQFDRQNIRKSTISLEDKDENNRNVASRQLLELKVMNDKLQREIQLSSEKFTSLKLENQHLQNQIEDKKQDKFVITSPSFMKMQRGSLDVGQNSRSPVDMDMFQNQQHKLSLLESENYNLTKQIKSLHRNLDEKSQQLDKINHDFLSQPTNQVSVDQLQFYQQQSEQQLEKTKYLMKLTQRFLYAMKKLQKAVHRKEPNVQKEKSEFELSRKELENTLKQLKKEFEGIAEVRNNNQPLIGQGSGVRASSLGRISNDEQPSIQTQIHKYQNNTFSARNHERSANMKKHSTSYQVPQPNQNRPSNNPYSVNQSLGHSSIVYEQNNTSKEKSPIPLRTKINARNSNQHEQFKSIEPIDRRRDPLLSSLERQSNQRSPSLNAYEGYSKISLDNSQQMPANVFSQTLQLNNMKNEIELLRQEVRDLLSERETLSHKIGHQEREKDSILLERQQLEKQLDRELKKSDATKRELNDLCQEKDALLTEYKRLRQQLAPEQNERELQEAQEQNEKLFDQLQMTERINQEYKRTIEFLEESQDAAKQTITDLKEMLTVKDLELEDLEKYKEFQSRQIHKDPPSPINNMGDLRQVKTVLLERIDQVEQNQEQKFQHLEQQVQQKEMEISKLKRQLERKLKESEIQLQSLSMKKSDTGKVQELQQQVQELQEQLNEYKEQDYESVIEDQKRQITQYEDKIQSIQSLIKIESETQNLHKQHQYEKQHLESQLKDALHKYKIESDNYEKQINKLKSDHHQQLQLMQQNEQDKRETLIQENDQLHQVEVQSLKQELLQKIKECQNKHKIELEQKLKELKDKNETQLRQIQEENGKRLQEEKNLVIQMQSKDQQETQRKIQESEKHKWDKEKEKYDNLLKQEKENKDNEIIRLKGEFEQQIDELTQQISNIREQSLQQVQQKDKQLTQLKQQSQVEKSKFETALLEQEQQFQQTESDYLSQFEELNLNIENLTKDKNESLAQKQNEVTSLKQSLQKLTNQVSDKDSQISQLQQQISEQEDLLKRAQNDGSSQTQTLRQQIEILKNQIKQKDNDFKEQNKRQQEEFQREMQSISDDRDLQVQEKDELISQVENEMKSEKQKLQKAINELQIKYEKLSKEKELLTSQIQEQQLQVGQLNQQLDSLNSTNEELQSKISEINKQAQNKQSQLQSQINDYQQRYDNLANERDNLNIDITTYQQNEEQLQIQIDSDNQEKEDLKKKIADLIKQSQSKQSQLQQDMTSQISQLSLKNEELENQLQLLQNQSSADLELLKTQHQQALTTVQSQKEQQISSLRQQITDIENESKFTKTIRESLQQQVEKLQQEYQDKEHHYNNSEKTLSQQIQSREDNLKEKEQSIEQLSQDLNSMQTQLNQAQQEKQKSDKHNEHEINEVNMRVKHLLQESEQLKLDHSEQLGKMEKQIQELQHEKQKAQDQIKEMLNQTKFEKQSLEERLQIQLSDTLQQLQNKEQELLQKSNQYNNLESQYRQQQRTEHEYQLRLKQAEEESEQQQEEIQALEDQRLKHQQTLEKNRNLIQMLKTELQKSIDKAKSIEEEKALSENDKTKEFNNQIQHLKEQLQNQRAHYEDQIMDQKLTIDTLETEVKQKTELIDEAGKAMEEFNDEKHEIKAKFKHLQQLLDDVEEESSYKEDDEIDLDTCFDNFEKEFLKSRRKIESKIESLERENSILKDQMTVNKEEINQMQTKMNDVQTELGSAIKKVEINDIEVRKQLETAQRKIQNYKDKLIEKQKYINQIENEKKAREESAIGQSREQSVMRENLELLQKLQKAENELQNQRLSLQNRKQGQQQNTSEHSYADDSMRVDAQRINQIEDQLINLRKQLFQAKDQVIDTLSESFAKRIKDLTSTFRNDNLLRAKLSEMKSDQQIQTLNNNIKLIKQVNFFQKRLLVVQVLSNSECYVIDDSKLGESALLYLKSYLPTNEGELNETFLTIDNKQQVIVDKLEDQIKEIREERQELQQELTLYKSKLQSGEAFEDMKELKLIELEDEVGHMNSENMELRLKIKELSEKNNVQQIRIIELNEMIKDITTKADPDSANRKLIKLKEDNENLRQEMQRQQKRNPKPSIHAKNTHQEEHDEDLEEGSFLQGIQVADNHGQLNTSQHNPDNLFDQSSLYDVIEGLEEEKTNKQSQIIQKLQKELEELQIKNRTLQSEIQKSQSLNPSEQSVINHIKGTLIQFLKHCPLTDKNNEGLLTVIFSMMEFSKEDIEDIQDFRKRQRGSSQSNSQYVDTEGDIKKKSGKGILGMFKKKEGSVPRKPAEENILSPIRPMKR